MIVGFTIVNYRGHEKEAVSYIQKVCILESPVIARNIVDAGVGVNVFPSSAISLSDLKNQPFDSIPIETKEGKHILASAVNFNLELRYNGEMLRLFPTEYIYIDKEEAPQFEEYAVQGLVRFIPEINPGGLKWILERGFWDDNGVWIDSDFWRDSK